MAKKKEKPETILFKEDEVLKGIEDIEKSDLSPHLKNLVLKCLNMCLSVNALLLKNKKLRRLIGKFFGFKTEKKSLTKRIKERAKKIREREKETPKQIVIIEGRER